MNKSSNGDSALIVFAKAPIPGQVKTRLCPPLSPDEAATLHGTLVLDALERTQSLAMGSGRTLDRFLACAPSADHVFFKIMEARQETRLLDQIGDDLGTRMDQAFETVFAMGYQRVALMGTDLPTLPGSLVGEALRLLSHHDLVLGPAYDGGYYLIGLRRRMPELFVGIPWSTNQVFSLTHDKAESLGLKIALLPRWRDIDTIEDLQVLIEEADRAPRRGATKKASALILSARTAGVLRVLSARLRERCTPPHPVGGGAAQRST